MKTTITYLLLLFTMHIFSQGAMVVTDVSANASLKSQLIASSNQLAQLEKNYDLLKSAEEKYKKVNSIVTSVYKISEIIALQKEAITNVSLVLKNTKLTGKSRERLFKTLNQTLVSIASRVDMISNVLQGGFFNMTDKERIDTFKQERSSIFILVSKTRGYANPYRPRD